MTTEASAPTGGALEKFVCDALRAVEVKVADLTPEQRVRALAAPVEKAGLRGKYLGVWIMEAKNGSATIAEARAEQAKTERTEKTRKNITRSSDPDAKAISVAAQEFANVKSPFSPKEGREFLDYITVSEDGSKVILSNKLTGEGATLSVPVLRAFAQGTLTTEDAADKRTVREAMGRLSKGTTLWGRKLAAFIATALEQAGR